MRSNHRWTLTAIFVLAAAGAGVDPRAQSPAAPAFEVASVKQNRASDLRSATFPQSGGRFTATNVTLRSLIRTAYTLQDFQMDGGPGWIDADRYDIVAKAESDVPFDQMRLMLKTLLADRFKLAVHTERRVVPIYVLLMARNDGRLGPKVRPSGPECAALGLPAGMPPPPPPPGQTGQAARLPGCPSVFGNGFISGREMPMSNLAVGLSAILRRLVADRTGLSGKYDLDLEFSPELTLPGPPRPPAPGGPAPAPPDGPSLFTAMQEQLGLKLDPDRGPVDLLIIDRVEKPTED